jgi:ubiquinone/menaquinone biosynthesis C-methylase UbiE
MFNPKDEDFEAIKSWGLDKDPLKAIKDYSPLKEELRWLNARNRDAHLAYIRAREDYIQQKNYDHYYKTAEKPIDRYRWEYLKIRKAWYIMPLEWDRFAGPEVKNILDLGCGDGDSAQRMAEHIVKCWNAKGYKGHKLTIHGYDLNPSRIVNANMHCESLHPDISFHFDVCDVVGKGVPHPDKFFDYATLNGVLEILEDEPALRFMSELCRVTKSGVYVEDLADRYPGGYPRENFEEMFNTHGFTLLRDHMVFMEPFTVEGSLDPMEIWPINKVRIMFAVPKK